MRDLHESIEALEKWKAERLDNYSAWWGVTQIGNGRFEAVSRNDWGKGSRVIEDTLREALHKLCEALGI